MKKTSLILIAAGALALAGASLVLASNNASSAASTPALKSVSCPPDCGFMCRSHDEQELIEIVKTHALKYHGKKLSDDQIRGFMETVQVKGD